MSADDLWRICAGWIFFGVCLGLIAGMWLGLWISTWGPSHCAS